MVLEHALKALHPDLQAEKGREVGQEEPGIRFRNFKAHSL